MLRALLIRPSNLGVRGQLVRSGVALSAIATEQRRHSGHSKWAKIKRAKGAADMKRSELYSKLGLEIVSAIRYQGPDPTSNLRLAAALNKARAHSLPKDNIEKAFNRAEGKSQDGSALENVTYEAYGAHGVALIIEAVTDNRTRTAMRIRSTLNKLGGQIAQVSYLFEQKGVVQFRPLSKSTTATANVEVEESTTTDADQLSEGELDQAMEAAIEAGAEDIEEISPGLLEATCAVSELQAMSRNLANRSNYQIEAIELRYQPETPIDEPTDADAKHSIRRLLREINDIEDVIHLYTNLPSSSPLLP
ncbi:transcriptional regulator TACO1-like protein [Syncephalis plumigaleata]|nr:transcriptional regulator TACO1-like protein [Syncephalis plumigaleata]